VTILNSKMALMKYSSSCYVETTTEMRDKSSNYMKYPKLVIMSGFVYSISGYLRLSPDLQYMEPSFD